MGNVELAVIEHIVNDFCALALYLLHCRNAAYACKPVEHETEHVNAPAGRSVEHGVFFNKRIIAHDRWADIRLTAGKSLVNDNDRQSGRRHVFLSAGIDKAEF